MVGWVHLVVKEVLSPAKALDRGRVQQLHPNDRVLFSHHLQLVGIDFDLDVLHLQFFLQLCYLLASILVLDQFEVHLVHLLLLHVQQVYLLHQLPIIVLHFLKQLARLLLRLVPVARALMFVL